MRSLLIIIILLRASWVIAAELPGISEFESGNYRLALENLPQSASQGDAKAQYYLAEMYANGLGTDKDLVKAFNYYLAFANQNFSPAQAGVGMAYNFGAGTPKNHKLAEYWLRRCSEQNYPLCELALGQMYEFGDGVPKDNGMAKSFFQRAAKSGLAGAYYKLSYFARIGLAGPVDPDQSFILLRKSVDIEKNALSTYQLGYQYELGIGVPRDTTQAAQWYKLSAAKGNEQAAVRLALLYIAGDGVAQDSEMARSLVFPLADRGSPFALNAVGLWYLNGSIGKKNIYKAMELFEKAASKKFGVAYNNLAFCYGSGVLGEANAEVALALDMAGVELTSDPDQKFIDRIAQEKLAIPLKSVLRAKHIKKEIIEHGPQAIKKYK